MKRPIEPRRAIIAAAAALLLLLPFAAHAHPLDHIQVYHPFSPAQGRIASARIAEHLLDGSRPQASAAGEGWLERWLSIGGEGSVVISLGQDNNITIPHRPAAFPSHHLLPASGFLIPFTSLAPPPSSPSSSSSSFSSSSLSSLPGSFACVPAHYPPIRPTRPKRPFTIALVERGGCDFATKVRAAQERGAGAVVVGDGVARDEEGDEEGMQRTGGLITMFSPEDTDEIIIPSIFVSRASYLMLRDLLVNGTDSGRADGKGLWIDISEGADGEGALSSLLSFALLMPSLFLLATVGIHRLRVARQREADRAPPLLVLSLPERIWSPTLSWEKSPSLSPSSTHPPPSPLDALPPPPPISADEVASPPDPSVLEPLLPAAISGPSGSRPAAATGEREGGAGVAVKAPAKRYYSKDECAICMDAFQRGDVVRILPCGHVFHKDECDEWLMKWRKLCPTCRADVTLPQESTLAGATITPVISPEAPLDMAPRPTASIDGGFAGQSVPRRLADQLSAFQTWLFGSGIRLETSVGDEEGGAAHARRWWFGGRRRGDGDGERTPLVSRSRAGSAAEEVPERAV